MIELATGTSTINSYMRTYLFHIIIVQITNNNNNVGSEIIVFIHVI